MSLEKEAEEFMMSKQKETSDELTPEDREAFRFYLGHVVGSFLTQSLYDEKFRSAIRIAIDLVKKEKELFK